MSEESSESEQVSNEQIGQNDMSDSLLPIYRFEWDDGTTRTTEELPSHPAVEVLAEIGRDDPNCEVTLTGYST